MPKKKTSRPSKRKSASTSRIFVNLPTKDLNKSTEFFKKLGFSINEQFTNATAACVVISENIYAMLLTEQKFRDFARKEITDSSKATEVLLAVSRESREQVDAIVEKALAAGGKKAGQQQDYGWMYSRGFEDPDGHIWEAFWSDPSKNQPGN